MIDSLIAELRQQWQQLPDWLRRLALLAALLLLVLVLYTALWRPMQNRLDYLQRSAPSEQAQLEWLRTYAPIAKTMRAKMTSVSAPLLQTVEQSAISLNLRPSISRLESEGEGVVLKIDTILFSSLVNWLAELQATQGVVVTNAIVNAHSVPGSVSAELHMRFGDK